MNTIRKLIAKVKNLAWSLGQDGYMHILCSLIIAQLLASFLPLFVAGVITLAVGVSKELYDKFHPNHVSSLKDLICDIVGILIAVALCA